MSYDLEIGTHREPTRGQVEAWARARELTVEADVAGNATVVELFADVADQLGALFAAAQVERGWIASASNRLWADASGRSGARTASSSSSATSRARPPSSADGRCRTSSSPARWRPAERPSASAAAPR